MRAGWTAISRLLHRLRFLLQDVASCPTFDGIEMNEGFVRDHPGKSEADVRMVCIIVIATLEVLIIFDRKDLLEKNESIQDRGTDTACDGYNGLHPIWKIRCER